jgi:hypothetical protein
VEDTKYCSRCGAKTTAQDRFCASCGKQLDIPLANEGSTEPTTRADSTRHSSSRPLPATRIILAGSISVLVVIGIATLVVVTVLIGQRHSPQSPPSTESTPPVAAPKGELDTSRVPLSIRQTDAAIAALRALRKLNAAANVGVNYQNYSAMVIDAQASVDEALTLLPDCELKTELNLAGDAYADGLTVWNYTLALGLDVYFRDRVSLKHDYEFINESSASEREQLIRRQDALGVIWTAARRHIERVDDLMKQ